METGLLICRRACAAIAIALAVFAGSSVLARGPSFESVVVGDEAVSGATLLPGQHTSTLRGLLPKQRRCATRSDLPLVSDVLVACVATSTDAREGNESASPPRDSRAGEIHHATGPPATLLT